MADPFDAKPKTGPSAGSGSVGRTILAIFVTLPGLAGLVGFIGVTFMWIAQGFDFPGSDHQWMPIYIIPSAGLAVIAAAILGVIMRSSTRQNAAKISLFLAVTSALVAVLGFVMMLDCLSPGDMEDQAWVPLLVTALLSLLIVSLPPFLHWLRSGPSAGKPRN